MKAMEDYHDLYLKTDILLLADVFEELRNVCLEYYELDACHYFSGPLLSWNAMLEMTGAKLDFRYWFGLNYWKRYTRKSKLYNTKV